MSTDLRPESLEAQRAAGVEPVIRREPGFFAKGKANFLTLVREAARYRELKKTPYGLKPLMVFAFVSLIAAFDGGIFLSALPEIARDTEIDVIPLIVALQSVGIFVGVVYFGFAYYGDRGRRVPMVGIGAIISGVFSIFTSRANTQVGFGVTRFGDALGSQLLGTPIFSLAADYYPPETRGRVFAFSSLLTTSVTLGVPLLIGHLIVTYDWRLPFLISGPLMILTGIVVMLMLKEPIRGYMERRSLGLSEEDSRKPEEPPSVGEAWRTMWALRTYRRLFIASIPRRAVRLLRIAFVLTILLEVYGLDVFERNLVFFGQGLLLLPVGFLAVGLVDVMLRRRPQTILAYVGVVALIGSLYPALLGLRPPLWVIIAFGVVLGALDALAEPAETVLTIQILPAHLRTLGFAVFTLAAIPAGIAGILLAGLVEDLGGIEQAWTIITPALFLAGLVQISAAPLFERDLRSSLASQAASFEWRAAKEAGRGKLIVCRGVDVEYTGVQVLFGVDFDVDEGEVIALLGTNGAGKSTLLKAISGTQEASSGAIVLDGREITHIPPHEIALRGITHMPGGRGIFPDMTVRENLMLGNWTNDEKTAAERLARIFELFPVLRDRAGAKAGLLSGGEQQMLSLAQAFLTKPRLLMIDELSLGLSPVVVEQLIDVVKLINSQGTTIILVEQSVNVALTVAERCIFMEKGEVKFVGETKDLLRRPDILRAVYVKGAGALVEGAPAGALRTAREQRQIALSDARDALEVQSVSKSYGGVSAVDDVSFTLREGEILGVIGPNGAGKTTLFDLISGYQTPDEGRIVFDGVDVTQSRADERARKRMVRRFQDARLFPSLTVFENVLLALDRRLEVRSMVLTALQVPQVRKAERALRRRAERLIELLELGAYRDKFAKELSTGLRRITDIACVLATEPKLLLLDEPSTGIAQAEAESLGPLLRRVRFETGCSMLLIEHDMSLIVSVSDELMAMDQGRVLVRGAPDEVLNNERVIQSYLGTSEEVIRRTGILE